mgnify:CR=1 FL=1
MSDNEKIIEEVKNLEPKTDKFNPVEKEIQLSQKENELKEKEEKLHQLQVVLDKEKNEWLATEIQRETDLRSRLYSIMNSKMQELSKELAQKRDEFEKNLKAEKESFDKDNDDKLNNLKSQEESLVEERKKFALEKKSVDREKIRINQKEEILSEREDNINQEISDRLSEKQHQYEIDLSLKDQTIKDLVSKNEELSNKLNKFESFEALYGNSPDKIKNDYESFENRIKELERKIATLPPKEIEIQLSSKQSEYNQLFKLYSELEKENQNFRVQLFDSSREKLEIEKAKLIREKNRLENDLKTLNKINESLQNNLNRLAKPEMMVEQQQSRLEEIKNLRFETKQIEYKFMNVENEIDWLNNIYNNCEDFKFHFNKRILYAFHTALKISDWSIITVLAGVSGTGKSKLPELYSAFGGINFINIPVQPSWDSQESMLGYFNSIDNRFQAEPLLKYLVQCTESSPYNDCMSIVLLDEMNLAHIEHYFADFLSKLEERRIKDKNNLPKIEIKLGAQCPSYFLNLVRSVLWVGTMNQDETTKALSDKVIDRGLIINFPRPTTLVSMSQNETITKKIINKNSDGSTSRNMIKKNDWMKWVVRKIESDEQSNEVVSFINKLKLTVEQINNYLEPVGRAMGHRVWQSIEYYIYNYPTVRNLMINNNDGSLSNNLKNEIQIAFEDQIVQKVMPKLRGIEDRSIGKTCLDNIHDLLVNEGLGNLEEDFNTARELGYGQFIWSSAKYLKEEK